MPNRIEVKASPVQLGVWKAPVVADRSSCIAKRRKMDIIVDHTISFRVVFAICVLKNCREILKERHKLLTSTTCCGKNSKSRMKKTNGGILQSFEN